MCPVRPRSRSSEAQDRILTPLACVAEPAAGVYYDSVMSSIWPIERRRWKPSLGLHECEAERRAFIRLIDGFTGELPTSTGPEASGKRVAAEADEKLMGS